MNIDKNTGDNHGGIQSIQYAFAAALLSNNIIPPIALQKDTVQLTQAIIDTYFYQIAFPIETGSFQESGNRVGDGINYAPQVTLFTLGHRDQVVNQIKAIGTRGLVLIVTDNDGKKRMVGDPLEPVYQLTDFRSGSRFADRKGTEYTISGTTTRQSRLFSIIS